MQRSAERRTHLYSTSGRLCRSTCRQGKLRTLIAADSVLRMVLRYGRSVLDMVAAPRSASARS